MIFGGAFAPFGLTFALVRRPVRKTSDFFSTIGGGAADVAYLVRRFNIANRPLA